MLAGFTTRKSQLKKISNNTTIRGMMEMTKTTKTIAYELEAELPGLGWLKAGCSANSLKVQSNNNKKNF